MQKAALKEGFEPTISVEVGDMMEVTGREDEHRVRVRNLKTGKEGLIRDVSFDRVPMDRKCGCKNVVQCMCQYEDLLGSFENSSTPRTRQGLLMPRGPEDYPGNYPW